MEGIPEGENERWSLAESIRSSLRSATSRSTRRTGGATPHQASSDNHVAQNPVYAKEQKVSTNPQFAGDPFPGEEMMTPPSLNTAEQHQFNPVFNDSQVQNQHFFCRPQILIVIVIVVGAVVGGVVGGLLGSRH